MKSTQSPKPRGRNGHKDLVLSQVVREAFWFRYFKRNNILAALPGDKPLRCSRQSFQQVVTGLSGKGAMSEGDRERVEERLRNPIDPAHAVSTEFAQEILRGWTAARKVWDGIEHTMEDVLAGRPWQPAPKGSVPEDTKGVFVDDVDLTPALGELPVGMMIAELKERLKALRWHNDRFKDYEREASCAAAFAAKPWKLENCPDFIGERQVLDLLGSLYEWAGDWTNAVEVLDEFAELQLWIGDPIYEARVALRLCWSLYETGQYDRTIKTGHSALDRLRKLSSDDAYADIRTAARICDVLGLAYLRKGRMEPALLGEAVKITQEALRLREAIGAKVGIAATKIRLGIIYIGMNSDRAMDILKEAHGTALSHGAAAFACGARYNMAVIHLRRSQWYDALRILSECVEVQEKCSDEAGLAKSHNLLAVLWFHMSFQLPANVSAPSATEQTPVPECIHRARQCVVAIEDWQAIDGIGGLHVRHRWMWERAGIHLDECMKRARAWCRPEIFGSACIGKGWQDLVDDRVIEAEQCLWNANAHLEGKDEARDLLRSKIDALDAALTARKRGLPASVQ